MQGRLAMRLDTRAREPTRAVLITIDQTLSDVGTARASLTVVRFLPTRIYFLEMKLDVKIGNRPDMSQA